MIYIFIRTFLTVHARLMIFLKLSMKKINLAIIGGGLSNEREVSLMTSRQIAESLSRKKYNVSLVEIANNGKWIFRNDPVLFLSQFRKNGKNKNAAKKHPVVYGGGEKIPEKNFFKQKEKIDIAFIALHGKNGEDGKIQALLDLLGIAYTGSGVLASALGMNKAKCSEIVGSHKISIPKFISFSSHNKNFKLIKERIKKDIGYPCFVKPNESGSSIGISLVENEKDVLPAIKKAQKENGNILIQERIKGRELTCGVLGNTGQTDLVILPPVEIITHESKFFDYKTKYFSKTVEEICPAKIGKKIKRKVKNTAKRIHEILGCDGLTRSDFVLSSKNNKLYFLEINTIPGQTQASLCPKEAKAMGIEFSKFLDMQIELAIKKSKSKK